MDTIQYLSAFLNDFDAFSRSAFIVFAYVAAPACLVPISLVAYVSGLVLGDIHALLVYVLGYTASTTLYYRLFKILAHRKLSFVEKYVQKWHDQIDRYDIISLAVASLFLPFLPLIMLAALVNVSLRHLLVAILIGAFPTSYFVFQAGTMGRPVDGLYNPEKLILSVGLLAVVFVIQYAIGWFRHGKNN